MCWRLLPAHRLRHADHARVRLPHRQELDGRGEGGNRIRRGRSRSRDIFDSVQLRGNIGMQFVNTDQSSQAFYKDNSTNQVLPIDDGKKYTTCCRRSISHSCCRSNRRCAWVWRANWRAPAWTSSRLQVSLASSSALAYRAVPVAIRSSTRGARMRTTCRTRSISARKGCMFRWRRSTRI